MRDAFRNKRTGYRSMTGNLACRGVAVASVVFALSGCISSEPNLNLASADTQQTAPTPVLAVLAGADNTLLSSTDQNVQTNTGLVVPVQAPRNPQVASDEVETTENVTALAVTSETEAVNASQNVIEQSVTASANEVTGTTVEGSAGTETTQVAALSPDLENAATPQLTPQVEPKKSSFLDRLFGGANKPKNNSTRRITRSSREDGGVRIASAHRTATRNTSTQQNRKRTILSVTSASNTASAALPGVKSNAELFGINDAESDDDTAEVTQVAAVGSLGRLSPNGIRVQHAKVQVACLKPGVVRLLKMVERRYGRKPIVTSGYRSPKRNRRAGGARNSQHIFCKAADIQVEGVSKWQLAKYLRTIPGRGGVGTYCRTKSVHIDIGSKRDWHHPCRRSKVKKRKKA